VGPIDEIGLWYHFLAIEICSLCYSAWHFSSCVLLFNVASVLRIVVLIVVPSVFHANVNQTFKTQSFTWARKQAESGYTDLSSITRGNNLASKVMQAR
jgi:hypothetical protein